MKMVKEEGAKEAKETAKVERPAEAGNRLRVDASIARGPTGRQSAPAMHSGTDLRPPIPYRVRETCPYVLSDGSACCESGNRFRS